MEETSSTAAKVSDSTAWISASAALQLVSQHNGPTLATTSIRNRASSGLLRSWALLFRKQGRNGTVDFARDELPSEFWRASQKGGDWAAGDFKVQVSGDRHGYRFEQWEAFGVMFDRAGIEAMLAPPALTKVTPEPPNKTSRQAGRSPASWWPAFAEELAVYVHENGIPSGTDAEGQSEVIAAVFGRMAARGLSEPTRTTVQPVVSAILRRLRSAGN